MVTMKSLWYVYSSKTETQHDNIALSNGDPIYDLPFPQNGGPKYTARDKSNFKMENISATAGPIHFMFRSMV